jgi:hypothetical protein
MTARYASATERTPQRPHGRDVLAFLSDEEIVVDRFICVVRDGHGAKAPRPSSTHRKFFYSEI